MTQPVFVAAIGANTAVGRSAWASAAAVRAGISGFTEHPYMIDSAGEPMRAAIAPWLDIGLSGAERFEALLFPAIDEVIASFAAPLSAVRCALALALPGPRPGLPGDLATVLKTRIARRYKSLFGGVADLAVGHAGGLLALQAAYTQLRRGVLDACVVAGVESWIEPETLEWLEAEDQLHSAGPLNNAWGFIPGEAGAALLLVTERIAQVMKIQTLAAIVSVGSGNEPKCMKTETVCLGEGLTEAFRQTLKSLPKDIKVTDIYCDMNGEPYRADEFGFSVLRTREHFESAADFVAPADCWGDVSAAGAPLHVILACAAARKGYANGPLALIWASSAERNERAAALLATPHED
jgi:3-oxoacyl-[acyl-carrier-protein] synthase-1